MSLTNWCEWLKERATEIVAPTSTDQIYSNIDPSRNFNGRWSLEFAEREIQTINYITGATRARRRLTAAVRAASDVQAAALAEDFRPFLLEILSQGKADGRFSDYAIEQEEIGADARGLSIGESFYAFIDFVIVENKDFSALI